MQKGTLLPQRNLREGWNQPFILLFYFQLPIFKRTISWPRGKTPCEPNSSSAISSFFLGACIGLLSKGSLSVYRGWFAGDLTEGLRKMEDVAEAELVGELLEGECILVDCGAGMLDAAPLLEMGWGFTQALCESLAETLVANT
jgi:hypothetical protein